MALDTIFRVYSLTKIVTSVALLQLYEQGLFQLEDPVSAFLPRFGNLRANKTRDGAIDTEPLRQPITVRHLLTHTSGLTYGCMEDTPVGQAYGALGVDESGLIGGAGAANGPSLEAFADALAEVPLKFQPGEGFCYGCSTDVVGRLVEILSGRPFDVYLRENVFEPLGMVDTGFALSALDEPRLATIYEMGDTGLQPAKHAASFPTACAIGAPPRFLSGGAGLLSTVPDILRFSLALAGGGSLGSARILGRKTVELMTRNHLPGRCDMATLMDGGSMPDFRHVRGLGFGLGVAVVTSRELGMHCSDGSYFWQGIGCTYHFHDPAEQLTAVAMSQFFPVFHPCVASVRFALAGLVEQAIID